MVVRRKAMCRGLRQSNRFIPVIQVFPSVWFHSGKLCGSVLWINMRITWIRGDGHRWPDGALAPARPHVTGCAGAVITLPLPIRAPGTRRATMLAKRERPVGSGLTGLYRLYRCLPAFGFTQEIMWRRFAGKHAYNLDNATPCSTSDISMPLTRVITVSHDAPASMLAERERACWAPAFPGPCHPPHKPGTRHRPFYAWLAGDSALKACS